MSAGGERAAARADEGLEMSLAEIGAWVRALRRVHRTRAAYLADRRLRDAWRAAVLAAVAAGVPAAWVAQASGVSPSRISHLTPKRR